jgi:arginine-tRNA-protein transferase
MHSRADVNSPTPPLPEKPALRYYSTALYPCSYLPGRQARSLVAGPTDRIDHATYSKLVASGFRRSGLFTYRPDCPQCQACEPMRIPVESFRPSRAQRRTTKAHQNLVAQVLPLHFSHEHFALYQRYQAHRHPGGGMDLGEQEQYVEFLLQSRLRSRLVEFRAPSQGDAPGALQMVCVVDLLTDGLSAVYTFYEPESTGSLGTYGVLWQIEQTKRLQLPYLYLGYWIAASAKMAYKARFRPHQLLRFERWQPSDDA